MSAPTPEQTEAFRAVIESARAMVKCADEFANDLTVVGERVEHHIETLDRFSESLEGLEGSEPAARRLLLNGYPVTVEQLRRAEAMLRSACELEPHTGVGFRFVAFVGEHRMEISAHKNGDES